MAKSKKTVEIPLVRSGAAVESGDVNFTFNNELIGSLSESGTAVLKTKDTIVRKDIEVEYTKPAGGGAVSLDIYRLTLDDVDYHTISAVKTKTLTDVVLGNILDRNTIISEGESEASIGVFLIDTSDYTKRMDWYQDRMTSDSVVPNLTAINTTLTTTYNALGYAIFR